MIKKIHHIEVLINQTNTHNKLHEEENWDGHKFLKVVKINQQKPKKMKYILTSGCSFTNNIGIVYSTDGNL